MLREKNKKGEFIKGAVWIAFGGFTAKVIGALYRIPLTNLIGGKGLGLYQMIYPVYCLLLTVSATGIPSSIAKLTAERIAKGGSGVGVFKRAMKLFLLIGGAGSIVMLLIAPFLSKAQGIQEVMGGYFTLSPSVFLVSAISVFRGYFQGKNKMYPTAVSEITEQTVKVGFGLLFAYLYRGNIEKAVVYLLLSVSISELFSLLLMCFFYKREQKKGIKRENAEGSIAMKAILRLSIPVTFSAIILPISSLLDSMLVPRLLGRYTSDAVTLFGLFAGGAVTVINLPVSICYGIAAASVPSVASAKKKEVKKRIFFALGITALVGVVSFLGLYFFADMATIIFRSLKGEELAILIKLIKSFSISALTLSCVQTLSACLTAQGKPQYAAISMLIAMIVKTVCYLFWLRKPQISIFGLAWASNISYLVAFLVNLLYNLRVAKKAQE